MNRKYYQLYIPAFLMMLTLLVTSCDDSDSELPNAQFEVTIENTGQAYPILKSDAFTTPIGASSPGPLLPGQAYEFEFTAPIGSHLSFATMFAQSNDWFFSPYEDGIPLYNSDGSKVTGDITAQIDLFDAGTEDDEEVGVGDNQAPRQSGPNTGPEDDNPNVRVVDDNGLPSTEEMIRVTLTSTTEYGFKVRIENSSNDNTLQTSEGNKPALLSPGTWLVHSASESGLLFTLGQPDYGDGLEAIAEDGNPEALTDNLSNETGLTTLLSPGAFAVFQANNPIFQSGIPAPSNGIEAIAEDGQPDELGSFLSSSENVSASGVFNIPNGKNEPAILFPGETYSFTFDAEEGQRLTFATMFAQSNDLFFSPNDSGIRLFENGSPVSGNVTDQILLWDAGTEANAEPGVGQFQAPRQSELDLGPADPNSNVREVDDGFNYGMIPSHIDVTIRLVQN